MSAPVQVLISELQCRILVEVYLAHGPVDIFRLWSEMFERQKSISSGMLLFTRAIVQLEDEGYLQKVAEMSSTLAPKGEMYLIGAVLSGELPEGCWEKLSSTQNILDVAGAHIGASRLMPSAAAEKVAGQEGLAAQPQATPHDCGTNLAAIRPSRSAEIFQGTTEIFQGTTEIFQGTTEIFQGTTIDKLLALVASKLPDISVSRQHELEEIEAEREGGDTAASGYNDPASNPRFA